MTAKVTVASNYGRAIVIVIGTFSLFHPPAICLSLSHFITPTIDTIDPMITAENIIVNTYDPLMTMDHSRCQIAGGWNGADCARVLRRNHACITAPRIDARGANMTNIFTRTLILVMTNQTLKAPARYRIKLVPRGINNATRINFPLDRATMFI